MAKAKAKGGKRRRRWPLVFGVVVVALLVGVGAFVVDLLADAGSFRTIEPHFDGTCRPVSGLVGPEDVEVDREGGVAYVSSSDFRALAAGRPTSGGIYAYPVDGSAPPARLETDLEGPFNPHGISLFREGGALRLFAVSHLGGGPTSGVGAGRSAVEIFAVEGGRLRHLRTVSDPTMVSPNDVAAAGPERFYFTNDAGTRADSTIRLAETYLRLPWANVAYFDGERARAVVEGLVYANGVTLSRDGSIVFVTESSGRRLSAYDRDAATGGLTLRDERPIPTALDNLSVAEDGALWVGAHPQMLAFVAHARDPSKRSPSQVLRVPWSAGRFGEPEEIYLGDGSALSGSSVAAPLGERFLIGAVYENHFLDCRRATR